MVSGCTVKDLIEIQILLGVGSLVIVLEEKLTSPTQCGLNRLNEESSRGIKVQVTKQQLR